MSFTSGFWRGQTEDNDYTEDQIGDVPDEFYLLMNLDELFDECSAFFFLIANIFYNKYFKTFFNFLPSTYTQVSNNIMIKK